MESELREILSYNLPPNRIAQRPVSHLATRDSSKLLFARSVNDVLQIKDCSFLSVSSLFNPGDVLVLNSTKVIHARFFIELESGKHAEILLVKPLEDSLTWECLGKPLKKLESMKYFSLSSRLKAEVICRVNEGRGLKIRLIPAQGESLEDIIREDGFAPIPPYIRDGISDDSDKDLYQTVYANDEGSVAAPTAGLHFTEEILKGLEQYGVEIHKIILHVGPYSFFPVAENIEDSQVLEERFLISEDTYLALKNARKLKRRIIAVGTTVVRCLETVFKNTDQNPYVGQWSQTQLMITPGYEFQIVNAMFTNFHQPRSTHLLLVSAFLGVNNISKVYAHALAHEYRFLSYGDSSFLETI